MDVDTSRNWVRPGVVELPAQKVAASYDLAPEYRAQAATETRPTEPGHEGTPMNFDNLFERMPPFTRPLRPLMVAYGAGVDSTAMLVELVRRYRAGHKECMPEAILFADVGDEWPETYAYLPVINSYLMANCFPPVITVRYEPKTAKYNTLLQNCMVNKTLPSLAFGYKKCSLKFKRQPQDKWTRQWTLAQRAWIYNITVIKAIGYDAGPKDARRCHIEDDNKYHYWYPLREIGWDRERCVSEILKENLPVPRKSSCYYCPSSKPWEIEELCRMHPHLGQNIVNMEANAAANNTRIEGLWRSSTRTRPGSMTKFITTNQLLKGHIAI